jgi:hypothetical protein
MKILAEQFRNRVETEQAACWNLSDYALLCWLSVGGTPGDLRRLWQMSDTELTTAECNVIDVLKEKRSIIPFDPRRSFVETARHVARSAALGRVNEN